MRKMRLSLLERLEQLETEQYQNTVAIIEVHRRLYTLPQVKSWSLPGTGHGWGVKVNLDELVHRHNGNSTKLYERAFRSQER